MPVDRELYEAWCERIRLAHSRAALTPLYSELCALPASHLRTELLQVWVLSWRRMTGTAPLPGPFPPPE